MIDTKVINAEMLVHVGLCTHKEPKDVLLLGSNESLEKEIARYKELHVDLSDKLSFVEGVKDKSQDVVIVNSNRLYDITFLAQIKRVLKDDGIVVLKTNEKYKENLQNLNSYSIAMLFRYEGENAIVASRKYHPTADIILQRSDLIDGLSYYNSEVHLASFAQPTYLRAELLGIQKN